MTSVFGRIFRYRPSEGRTPTEDFFTETLAAVLEASEPFRLAFVKWLINHDVDVDFARLETQKTVENGRLDLWIDAGNERTGERHVIAMENKIAAGEGKDQLQRYERHLKRKTADTRTLVYVTLHKRTSFQGSLKKPKVDFRQIHWFKMAEWMREWTTKPANAADDKIIHFVRELLLLMEEWGMAVNLNADHLAAATIYHTSVGRQLIQILDETYEACELPGTKGNQWNYNTEELYYTSPWIDKRKNIYVEFGFNFDRDDADFSVPQLRVPSAYFAVGGTHRPELDNLRDWKPAPEDWDDDYVLVKWLGCLRLQGESLHDEYIDFFKKARDQLWRVTGLSQ